MAKLHKSKSNPNPVGRQWFEGKDIKEVVAKLENVFAIDGTVEEACSYAEISRDSFYRYLKANPDLRNRIEDLRQKPVLKARQTVVTKLGESYSNAMDYLKRKRRLEFGDSTDITTGGQPFKPFDELPKDISIRKNKTNYSKNKSDTRRNSSGKDNRDSDVPDSEGDARQETNSDKRGFREFSSP